MTREFRYLPKRIKPCPECGDRETVQYIVEGMPAVPPTQEEEDRSYFAGCVIVEGVDDEGNPLPRSKWVCTACGRFYR